MRISEKLNTLSKSEIMSVINQDKNALARFLNVETGQFCTLYEALPDIPVHFGLHIEKLFMESPKKFIKLCQSH